MSKIRVCFRGHKVKKETDKELVMAFPYYCPICDENMYAFETKIKKGGRNNDNNSGYGIGNSKSQAGDNKGEKGN